MKKSYVAGVVFAVVMVCGVLGFGHSRQEVQPAVFDHVALQAVDLEKSAQFYESVLGLKRIPDPFKDGKHIWLAMGPTQQLHLDPVEKALPTADDSHMAVRVGSVEEMIRRLDAAKVKWEGFHGKAQPNLRPDGVHQIYFQDPSGNWVEVNDRKVE